MRQDPGARLALPHLSRRTRRVWEDAVCALGGALVVLLALDRAIGPAAAALRGLLGASDRLEPYIGFTLAVAAALGGVGASFALQVVLERAGKRHLAPLIVFVLVAVLGLRHARWLVWAAPGFLLLAAPLLVTGRARSVPQPVQDRSLSLLCIASEAASIGVGVWLPFAEGYPAMLVPAMVVPAAVAAHVAAFHGSDELRWRVVLAGLPALLLTFVGLQRNPTLLPTALVVVLGVATLAAFAQWPGVARRGQAWARAHAPDVALPALVLVLIVPWHFRDLGLADLAGHEGQHLGWLNSISFGKMMMADAGFTYGPAREYSLALLTWVLGGLTLEHVRIAHVIVNVAGLVCIFAAMRRVCAGQAHLLLLGLALLITHSAVASFVVYTKSYSLGWADACRAGLPTLAVVVALTRPLDDARRGRLRLVASGVLVAFSVLYSHDFGVPAVLATLVGLASEALVGARRAPWRSRVRSAGRNAAVYVGAAALVLAAFVLVYAVRGKTLALLRAYRWTVVVSSGRAFPGLSWHYASALDSLAALRSNTAKDEAVVARALDHLVGPALAILGLANAASAALLRRFTQRTTVILALAVLTSAAMHHAFLASDPWHMANGTTPGLVLLIALCAGGRRFLLRWPGHRPVALGVACAGLLPLLWLSNGGAAPINMRLARIASGEERPSKGAPYDYPDLPRVGDMGIGSDHLDPVRFVRAHSKPDEPVFFTTWMLGGGTEAFLSQRRNPTSFDKPDEVMGDAQRDQLRGELEKDPPVLIVGKFFDYLGDTTRRMIDQGWHVVPAKPLEIRQRNR
jgi:hypothetical protein